MIASTFTHLALADTTLQLDAAKLSMGERVSWLRCPCYRWVVQAEGPGGRIETRRFLISSESLLKLREEKMADLLRSSSRIFSAGAIEALRKTGIVNLGLGSDGVSWGEDVDRGYSDLLSFGLHAIAQVVPSDGTRIELKSGYDFTTLRMNLGPQVGFHRLDQSAAFRWRTRRWAADLSVHVGLDPEAPTNTDVMDWGASARAAVRIVDFHGIRLGAELEVEYEREGNRYELGFDPEILSETFMMNLSYVAAGAKERLR
jgi:hypothetical protein